MTNAAKWFNAYVSLKNVVGAMKSAEVKYHKLEDTRQVIDLLEHDKDRFEHDFKKSKEILKPFLEQWDPKDAQKLRDMFRDQVNEWQNNPEDAPSMMALQSAFYDLRGYEPSENSSMKSSLMTAILGHLPQHNHGYHNTAHFREVLLGGIVLLTQEEYLMGSPESNGVYNGKRYSEDYVCDDCRTKISHDLFHSGKNNSSPVPEGRQIKKHEPFYLEKMPTEGASGYLRHCGLSEEKIQNDNVVILCTDVSKGQADKEKKLKPKLKYSGAEYLRMATAYHAGEVNLRPQHLPKALRLLVSTERNEELYGNQTRGEYLTDHANRMADSDLLVSAYCRKSSSHRYAQLNIELPEVYNAQPDADGTFTGFIRYAFGGALSKGKFKPECHSTAGMVFFQPEVQTQYSIAKNSLPKNVQQQMGL